MDPFGWTLTSAATVSATMLAYRAYRKRSLTPEASVAAFTVAFLLVGSGLRGFNLLVFYGVAMKATKYKKDLKAKIDGTISSNKGSTTRGVSQVLACSALAVILSLVHVIMCGAERPIQFQTSGRLQDGDSADDDRNSQLSAQLSCAIVAHHATCLADTLASEIGSTTVGQQPILITQPWKRVPPGTNGGITLNGCVWSAIGGLIIGSSTIIFDLMSGVNDDLTARTTTYYYLAIIVYATVSGLLGSLLDSLLGATLQQSYYDPDTRMVYQTDDDKPKSSKLISGTNVLTNEMVNVVSVAMTTIIGGWVLGEPVFNLFVDLP